MTRLFVALALIASCLIAINTSAQDAALRNGFDIGIPVPPTPVRVGDHWQVSYEIHLTNFSAERLTVTGFTVSDARDGHTITALSGQRLMGHATLVGSTTPLKGNQLEVAPGQQAVLFMDFTVPINAAVATIRQRVDYTAADGSANTTQIGDTPLMSNAKPSLIAPPLRGGPWVAIHNAAWPRGHRRVFYTVAGHARLPGRFAVDWVKLDGNGRMTKGDPDVIAQAYGYGDDVLAVADATVAAVRDGMDEPARISQRTTHQPADDAGNYVALKLPDGRFAFYEHLKKGSVKVAVGDKVATGDVIGSLGFSGESTGPHLHFHVANGNSPLDAEGLPFEIRRFHVLGSYPDIAKLGTPWVPLAASETASRLAEWPDASAVLTFDP
ncbi:M23 family metallopeptidase [Dyella sp. GSA-30]|uniref:M23 family metallopeptidase n=1 Tax=Dyella sp. GSA-30 TaxID=2994496 RepID=UPI002491FE96|nr:M23 family metallopeptidase [Dyella sp. GSA-30]BDU21836.1 peptidase M23 [Dyella sp. GSA-30]